MVERTSLVLAPWCTATAGGGAQRHLADAATGLLVGSVRRGRESAWWGCAPARFDVCETEDLSLLMSIEHGWFALGRWQVLDAERGCVGAIVGRHLLDHQGGRFATMWCESENAAAIRNRHGRLLAHMEVRGDRCETLRFADDLPANPFVRMVLLAAWVLRSS